MAYFNYLYRPSTNENRSNVRLVWLTTNWKHNGKRQKPGMPARLLEEKDAKLVVIGIGIQKRHVPELQAIASRKDNFVQFPTYLDYFKAVEDEA